MTPSTAAAFAETLDEIYRCFASYRVRLSREPRVPEDQAVFDQLFAGEIRALSPARLASLVSLLKLPEHRFGALELKVLLPRLCEVSIDPKPRVGFSALADLLGRFHFEQWPNEERALIWEYLMLTLRGLLEEFSGRRAPPWGVYGYLRELSWATEHLDPALLSWEMADFPTADLHLAAFAKTWIEDRPVRELQPWGREPTAAIERWLHTSGREKLRRAVGKYQDEPFRIEFESALARLEHP